MTDDAIPTGGAPTDDAMAAEYALGLLEGEERRIAARRELAEPDFAAEVARWRAHFGILFEAWPDAAAPADGLKRIERALPLVAANANERSPRLWQGIAAVSSLIAASLLMVLVLRPVPQPVQPQPPVQVAAKPIPVLVAAIVPVKRGAPIAAVYDPVSGALRVAPAALVDAGHSAELWVIAKDGVPHSLGVLAGEAKTDSVVGAPVRAGFVPGSTLAVTIEPVGGAPGGKPTGAVIAAGPLLLI